MSAECLTKSHKGGDTKVVLTEEEQLEYDLQQEAELARVQRQHRILERDRNAFATGAKIMRQRKSLKILYKENSNILTDLKVATSKTKRSVDTKIITDLHNLIGDHGDLDGQIKAKKERLKEIDEQIEKVQKAVAVVRAKLPTDFHHQERVLTGQKTVEALENKLDAANKRFCTVLTENQSLRDEVEHLLHDRIALNKLWEKLIDNLNRGKSFMIDIIEQATIAYDQREEWCGKLQALRVRGHSDLIVHTQEMQRLHRIIDNDTMLEDFLVMKGRRRIMTALEEKELLKRKEIRAGMQARLQQRKEVLAQILDFMKVDQIPDIVKEFYKKESENSSLFEAIINMHANVENITYSIFNVSEEINELSALRERRQEHQVAHLLAMNFELTEITMKTHKRQARVDKNSKILKSLCQGVGKLFTICNCDKAPILQLLGSSVELDEYNILLHLQILENRICELAMDVYYKEKTIIPHKKGPTPVAIINEVREVHPIHAITNVIPTNPCPLCVDQELVSDVIDVLQFPLTKDEVTAKLEQRLQLPGALEVLHNVSACNLPKSRHIIQKRYQ